MKDETEDTEDKAGLWQWNMVNLMTHQFINDKKLRVQIAPKCRTGGGFVGTDTVIRTRMDVLIRNADNESLRSSKPQLMQQVQHALSAQDKRELEFAQVEVPQNGKLGRCERMIMAALAQYPQGRTPSQIAILTGYSLKSGGFNNALATLRTSGLINRGQPITLTEQGKQHECAKANPLPKGQDLLDIWLNRLPKCERMILELLYKAYPQSLSSQSIAEVCGYSANSGGFNNALSKLRTLELITRGQPIKISEDFFQ